MDDAIVLTEKVVGKPPQLRTGIRVYILEPMTLNDIDEVSAVEALCFPTPWPVSVYRRELRNPGQNYYVVLRDDPEALSQEDHRYPLHPSAPRRTGRFAFWPLGKRDPQPPSPPIIGFTGMWYIADEAHVTTIGVHPRWQRKGLGELLFLSLIDEAIRRGASLLSLEVRVSNFGAQHLYGKYGFTIQGRKPRYYTDNHEDAYIMWSPSLHDPEYLALIEKLRRKLNHKLSFLPSGSSS